MRTGYRARNLEANPAIARLPEQPSYFRNEHAGG